MKKILIQLPVFIVLCSGIIFISYRLYSNETVTVSHLSSNIPQNKDSSKSDVTLQEENTAETTTVPETTSDSFTITLSFIGDCLCATNENTQYENCFNDVADEKKPSYFFKKVNSYFLNDDFTVGDCENVFSDSKNLQISDKGQYQDPGIEAYWFKSAAKNAKILSAGGIDCVSISNNHINDYGEQGHEDTKAALDAADVEWGEEGKIVYYEKNGFCISVICFSMYGSYAVPNIIDAMREAVQKSDYQIIYFHGGEEAVHEPESWKIEACHDLIDAGADLIMGDHPHVLQPMEEYNGATIIYSLGNFIFGGNRHPENRTVIYQHTLTITDDILEKQQGNIIPCYVYTGETNNWQPDIIKDKNEKQKVLDFMLGKTDLPY